MNKIHQTEIEVLSKLIEIQFSSASKPDDENLSQFIYNSLKELDIVDKCRLSLKVAKKPVGDVAIEECETCEYFETYIPKCLKANRSNTSVLSVRTRNEEYGFIVLKFKQQISDALQNAFQNFASLIAMNIENYLQREQLEEQNKELFEYKNQLEKLVEEKTDELVRRNKELTQIYEVSRKNELRLNSILRAAPTCLGIKHNRILLDVNDYMCELLGYNKEELIGKIARILYPSDSEFNNVGEEKYNQIRLYGKGTVETKWVKKNGEILDILLSSTPLNLDDLSEGTSFTAVDITPLKRAITQANDALRKAAEEHEKFKNVFDYSVFPIAIADKKGKIIAYNNSFVKTFGYTIDDIPDLETLFNTVYPDEDYRNSVRKKYAELVEIAKTKNEPTKITSFIIKCKNGENKIVELTSFELENISFAMFHDITDEIKSLEQLQESKAKLQALIENTTESIWAVDREHKLIYINKAFKLDFEKAFLVNIEIGTKLIDLLQEPLRTKWLEYYSRAFNGEQFIIEDVIETPAGNQYIQVSVNPIYLNNEIIGISFFGKNVTEKKLRELEIQKAKEQAEERELLLNEMGQIAKIGGWKVDLETNQLTWTKQIYDIHEVPYDYIPTVEKGIDFYYGESKEKIAKLVNNAIEKGETYDEDLQLLTAKGKVIQVRAQGKVKYDDYGKPVSIYGAFQDISERKKVEEEIKMAKKNAEEREQQFRELFENAADAIFIADINTGIILDVNKKGLEMMKTTKDKVVGLHQTELHPKQKEVYSKETFRKHEKEIELSEHVTPVENILVTSDDREIPVEILASKINYNSKECIMGIFRDITERKKAQEEISYKNKYLNLLLKIASEHINVSIDKFNQSINQSMEDIGLFVGADRVYIFDYDWSKNTCSNIYEWCREGISPQIKELQNISNDLLGWWTIKHKNKEYIYIDATENLPESDAVRRIIEPQAIKSLIAIPLINKNECTGFVGFDFVRDYHNYSEQEKFLLDFFAHIIVNIQNRIELHKNLMEAKDKAEESDRLKTAFLLNLSHEIRTPMNGILGFLNLLGEPNLSREEIEQYVQIVNKGSERLISTINDLIEISRIQANEIKVSKEFINIRSILKSHHTLFKNQIQDKGLEFKLNENLPNTVSLISTDLIKIDSILFRLIQNAIKFTKQGSIEIGNYIDKNDVVFFVKDTGKGINKKYFEDVFKPFYQVDTNLARDHEGSGLGLAIAKAYVELLGGKIWLESEEKVGSTFYFSIPIEV